MQRAALGGPPQVLGGAPLVGADRAVEFTGEQQVRGLPVQAGEFECRTVAAGERAVMPGEHEGGVPGGVGERGQLLTAEIGVVDVDGGADAGHQTAQLGLRRRVPRGVVAGLEDLLGEVGGFAAGRVEIDHAVPTGRQAVRGVPEQRAGADAGRAEQLHQAAVPHRPFQRGEFGGPADRLGQAARQQRDLLPPGGSRPPALDQQGHGGAVLRIDQQVVVTDDHAAVGVAADVDAVVPGFPILRGGRRWLFGHRAAFPTASETVGVSGRPRSAAAAAEGAGPCGRPGERREPGSPSNDPWAARLVAPPRRDAVK